MTALKNVISGLIIGVANIIPGVSGGTMMVILNMFDKILDAIGNFKKDIKNNILFLLQIIIGAAIGIVLFSKGITYMLSNYPTITNMFFIGLILGSFPLVYRNAFEINDAKKKSDKKISVGSIIVFIAAFALLIVLTFTNAKETTVDINDVAINFSLMIQLFFGSMLGAIAMIIPGVSGSFVMMLIGIYPIITAAIAVAFPIDTQIWASTVFPICIPVGLGIILGLLVGAKAISVLLKSFTQQTYFGILGLLFGSIFYLYPTELAFNIQGLIAITVAVFGFALAFFSSSERLKKLFR